MAGSIAGNVARVYQEHGRECVKSMAGNMARVAGSVSRLWQEYGEIIARAWQDHGRNMAGAWQEQGRSKAGVLQDWGKSIAECDSIVRAWQYYSKYVAWNVAKTWQGTW